MARRAIGLLALLLLSCDEYTPTSPREHFTIATLFGDLPVSGDPALATAILLGLDGGPGTASAAEKASLALGRPRESFAGALAWWSVVIRDRQAGYSLSERILYVDGRGADAARYSAGHEAMHALAWELRSCSRVNAVDHCGVYGPGRTLACEEC